MLSALFLLVFSIAIIVPTNILSFRIHRNKGLVMMDVLRAWALPSVLGGLVDRPQAHAARSACQQQRAASLFPDPVAVAEAGKRALVPVFDDVEPGVTEGLAVVRRKARLQSNDISRICRLAIVTGIFEREVRRRVELPVALFRRLRGADNRLR